MYLCNRTRLSSHTSQFSSLYSQGLKIDGGEKLNSSVFQVQRLNDKRSFVAKMIPYSKIRMATKEITVYKILGRHPRIAQFIEAFYDFKSGTHCKPSVKSGQSRC